MQEKQTVAAPRRPYPPGQRRAEDFFAELERTVLQAHRRDKLFGFGTIYGMPALALVAAAPLGWALIQLSVIPGLNAFTQGQGGRDLAAIIGRDLLQPAYILALGVVGWVLQICRPLVPLLLVGAVLWWSWLGLALAYDAGMIVMAFDAPTLR